MLIKIKQSTKEQYEKLFRKTFPIDDYQVQPGVFLDFEAFNNTYQTSTEQIICGFCETNEDILAALVLILSHRNALGN